MSDNGGRLMPFPQFLAPLVPSNHALCRCPVSRAEASKRILIMGLGALGNTVAQSLLLVGPTVPRRFALLAGCSEARSYAVPGGPCEIMTCANTDEKHLLRMRPITVDEAPDAASRLLKATRPAV